MALCLNANTAYKDFQMLRHDRYFVDKTAIIEKVSERIKTKNRFLCITKPRRFGKTSVLNMLGAYYGKTYPSEDLFAGLDISRSASYRKHLNGYNLISFSMNDLPGRKNTYQDYIGRFEKNMRNDIVQAYPELANREIDSLPDLLTATGDEFIFIIDEWDYLFSHDIYRENQGDFLEFLRDLLKDRAYVALVYMTSVLPIKKYSTGSALNMFKEYTMLRDPYFEEYFGFTEEEVRQICRDYKLEHKYELIREWYNGYVFGDKNVYNPWSLVRFIKDLKAYEDEFPSAYWANTSSNSIVRSLIEMADEETKKEIESLIEGKTVEKPVHEDITYDEIYQSMDNLWNFMFFTGYFRKEGERMDERTKQLFVTFSIPNEEVKYIFRTKILSWFGEQVKQTDRTALFASLVNQEPAALEEEIAELLLETISFNDAYESFYHGFLTGILSGMKGYIVKSNREGGTGRSDLFIKPVTRRKTAYVMEFKVAKRFDELEKRAEEALRQIEERQYVRELNDDGYASVVRYGMALFGKDCAAQMKV